MRNLPLRIFISCLNIFFPPLAVGLLDGFSTDCLVNSCLFLCGVIPSHIHGFYISCVYFSRKKKVRKGRYPGGRKAFIYTERVLNGGAGGAEVERLWEKQFGEREKGRGSGGRSMRARSLRLGSPRPGSLRQGVEGGYGGSSRVGSRRSDYGAPGRTPVARPTWR